jgi:predicted unusual protein kinase regulating ubiquinone biosynthesis (AarF/ABC1/UbiB family)
LPETALASASIAQVHKAVLRPEWAVTAGYGDRAGYKWTEVAVKVRHKTIAETLTGDLTTLRAMLGWQVRTARTQLGGVALCTG